jgi:DNA replicative helicase MCM subunit Mcm2 (Cdc46/Mcm family)
MCHSKGWLAHFLTAWPRTPPASTLAVKLNKVVCTQERPEAVPTGELPQSMTLIVDRHLVGKISPGTRVTAIGIYSIYQVHNYKLECYAVHLQQH